MADLNERIETLEKTLADLRLDLQASGIAITVLTHVINKMSGDPGYVASLYEEKNSSAPLVKFNHPEQDGYEEKLTDKVLALIAKTQ
ncbi:hypothetical protein [Pseudocitrobacter vendiensis]|uniref:Uncharacterized protein n=1 Tax=Pseudocitrobacter vendiensis TaxID=2488306 RepID=A0ABM9F873_9ENTR|nr:hypothetical protein [Pseudocitrobacter vendiensis]CAH6637005.1 hypothetical protein FBBNIHIM_09280 [Pseudocitrobacter vendiensis]